jgi:hypothetical protein
MTKEVSFKTAVLWILDSGYACMLMYSLATSADFEYVGLEFLHW